MNTLPVNDAELFLLTEALTALRAVKVEALTVANAYFSADTATKKFTECDFGIESIDMLKARIENLY